MKINKNIMFTILSELTNIYPYYSNDEHYKKLKNIINNNKLFMGHRLYLSEKELINTDLSWNPDLKDYQLNPEKLKISCNGIDYLAQPFVL